MERIENICKDAFNVSSNIIRATGRFKRDNSKPHRQEGAHCCILEYEPKFDDSIFQIYYNAQTNVPDGCVALFSSESDYCFDFYVGSYDEFIDYNRASYENKNKKKKTFELRVGLLAASPRAYINVGSDNPGGDYGNYTFIGITEEKR